MRTFALSIVLALKVLAAASLLLIGCGFLLLASTLDMGLTIDRFLLGLDIFAFLWLTGLAQAVMKNERMEEIVEEDFGGSKL